jgi:glyoxylase-like metal-dependent hydrolase (beta-lactamase superfamily II)
MQRVVVDCGDRRVAAIAIDRLQDSDSIELLVLTHVDNDRIGGARGFMEGMAKKRFGDVWFNGWKMLQGLREDEL